MAVLAMGRDIAAQRAAAGLRNHLAGLSAEAAVEGAYANRGMVVVARRWRGRSGEVDLICRNGAGFVFVEVKCAKSHDTAALRVSRAQIGRLMRAGQEYCDSAGRGSLTEMRFDLATVDGRGQVKVCEAAFWEDDGALAA